MNIIYSMLAAQAPAQMFGGKYSMIIIMVGFIAFFYLFVIRPQNKKRKEMEAMISSLKKGDKIVSIGGIHGKVSAIKDNLVVVKIDSNAEITFDKSAISKVDLGNAEKPVAVSKKETKKDSK